MIPQDPNIGAPPSGDALGHRRMPKAGDLRIHEGKVQRCVITPFIRHYRTGRTIYPKGKVFVFWVDVGAENLKLVPVA
jgi:hypothetical protein